MKENENIEKLASKLEKAGFKVQNTRDIYKLSELLLLKQETCFIAPVCPDYPLNSETELGIGMPAYTIGLVELLENLLPSIKEYGVPYRVDIILADTETDLEEVVISLAKTKEEFLSRCKASVNLIKRTVEEKNLKGINIETFSSFFGKEWHKQQYKWEDKIRNQIQKNERLKNWLEELANKRTKKYETQFKRILSFEEKLNMAIRHYAQYSALAEWMREKETQDSKLYILINSHSPNLKAMGKPLGKERIKKIIVIIPLNNECDF